MGRYLGKVCTKHPELQGSRYESSKKCTGCSNERNNEFRKSPDQRARMRVYQRAKESKGGSLYEAKKERNVKWYNDNKAWRRAYNLGRKLQGGRYPEHMRQIRAIYASRPEGHHVDHIIPIRGIHPVTKEHVICGLNVPWNLQYLPGEENLRKWAWFLPY